MLSKLKTILSSSKGGSAPRAGSALAKLKKVAIHVGIVAFCGYGAAVVVGSATTGLLLERMGKAKGKSSKKSKSTAYAATGVYNIKSSDKINYVTMRRAVLDRNVFNAAGEFPKEEIVSDKESKSGEQVFDPKAPCRKSSLRLKLVGTIYLGSPKSSLATLQESGYPVADVYRAGDTIAGQEGTLVHSVLRKRVILNNNGAKECIDFDEKQIAVSSRSYEPPGPGGPGGPGPSPGMPAPPADPGIPPTGDSGGGGCVPLEGSFVESELGGGFSKIISAARLVPNMADNTVRGFKIFAINRSSILGKVGFKNGDIITQVNDVSLKQPDQGFALYEAFQDERDIKIHVLRGGRTPKTLCVKIN